MTPLTAVGSEPAAGLADPLQVHEKIAAPGRRPARPPGLPGELGELVYRELIAYAEFGIRFSVDALVPRLATQILAMPPTTHRGHLDRRPARHAAGGAGRGELSGGAHHDDPDPDGHAPDHRTRGRRRGRGLSHPAGSASSVFSAT